MDEPLNTHKICIFLSSSDVLPSAYLHAQKNFSGSDLLNVQLNATLDHVRNEIESKVRCVLAFALFTADDVTKFLAFLQSAKKYIKAKRVVPIAILKTNTEKTEEALQKGGCADVLGFDISPKAFIHKLNLHIKTLEKCDETFEEDFSITQLDDRPQTFTVESMEPIESPLDFWLLAKSAHARKIRTHWHVELVGPSPEAGSWKDVSNSNSELRKWQWEPTGAFEAFKTKDANWFFSGKEPVYNWSINRWVFISSKPELSLYRNGVLLAFRFRVISDQQLAVSKNSRAGESIFSKIKETFYPTQKVTSKTNTLAPETQISWADQIDTKSLVSIGGSHTPAESQTTVKNYFPDFGIESMKPCGIVGTLKSKPIEFFGYTDDRFLLVSIETGTAVERESVQIQIKTKQLGEKSEYQLNCLVSKIVKIDEEKSLAKLMLDRDSTRFIDEIETSVGSRQTQLSSFFMQARGISQPPEAEKKQTGFDPDQIIKDYLSTSPILILDSTSTARVTLASHLVKLGAQRNNMALVGSLDEARASVAKHKHKIIFSDYMIGKHSGIDFIQEQKARFAAENIKDSLCILLTANAAQSTAARAAEEDVDHFVIKPYRVDLLKKVLFESIQIRLSPSPYLKLIEQGKQLLDQNNNDLAETIFIGALEKDPKPTLALYYLAQAQERKNKLIEAEQSYRQALGLNMIHYKCLSGLHELLRGQKRHIESYDTVKRIVNYFPANSTRLANVLRTAIVIDRFDDMEWYYKIFLNTDERSDELTRYMCSALVITGKHYLNQKTKVKALELFESAAVSAAGRTKFILYIVETLVDFEMPSEATRFLSRLVTIDHASPDCLAAEFLISTLTKPLVDAVYLGRKAIRAGVQIPSVHKKLISLSVTGGYLDSAQELSKEACALWPDKKF